MLRTNLLTLDKKVLCLSGVIACFSPAWGKFYKKLSMTVVLNAVQRHWTLRFHSNWGMFTVAKCEVGFHDTRYYLWRKPCVCAVSLCPAVAASPSWNCKLQSVGAYYLRLPCVYCLYYHSWKFRSARLIQTSCGTGKPTSFPPSLLEFDLFWQSSFLFISESCAFFCAIDSPIALNCAG